MHVSCNYAKRWLFWSWVMISHFQRGERDSIHRGTFLIEGLAYSNITSQCMCAVHVYICLKENFLGKTWFVVKIQKNFIQNFLTWKQSQIVCFVKDGWKRYKMVKYIYKYSGWHIKNYHLPRAHQHLILCTQKIF